MMNKKLDNKAFTLIEITLVLGLTLGLAAALIFGLSAFTNGADRAKCILNINNVQKAVRSLQNLNEFKPGDTSSKLLNHTTLWGSKDAFLSSKPICPRATTDQDDVGQNFEDIDESDNYKYYGDANTFPGLGVAYIECIGNNVNDAYKHNPKEIDGIRVDADDGGN